MRHIAAALLFSLALVWAGGSAVHVDAAQEKETKEQLEKREADIKAKINAIDKAEPKKADGPDPRFKTGARRTPLPKIIQSMRAGTIGVHRANGEIPASVTMVPPKLSALGNDRYGDCVTAESCFAIEADSVYLGLEEIVITDQACISWASSHGVLNGADLLSVMQDMQRDGIKDSAGVLRKTGTPSTVDYTNETILQSAIATGPVSIAIGSGDLPSGAGNASGWYALTSRGARNDHDVSLCGYGRAEDLFKALGLPCPAACAGKTGYLCYTWATIGFVTHAWITGTVQEAWVRTPTVIGLAPVTPPVLITVGLGDVTGTVGQPVTFMPLVSGGTGPYTFSYDYGDGTAKDATGSHTYTQPRTYTVTLTATDSKGATGMDTCKAVVGLTPPPPPGPAPAATISLTEIDGSRRTFIESDGTNTVVIIGGVRYSPASQASALSPAERQMLQQLLDRMKGKK